MSVLASSLWWTLPQTWRKILWLKVTAANSHGFPPPFCLLSVWIWVCVRAFLCDHARSYVSVCVYIRPRSSICLNVVGPSVSQVSVIRIASKSHQTEPLISHLAWWTPAWGTTEGRHVLLCLSFSLSVCLSMHDYTCLSLDGWRALNALK